MVVGWKRWRRLLALALVAMACVVTLPSSAFAQGDEYKHHMDNGVKLYTDKNFEAAIAEFQAAYKVRPKASPLVNISLCYKGLFAYPKAIATLEKALAKHPDTMSEADKKASNDAIAEMKALLGYVVVQTAPPNATVVVDGEDVSPEAKNAPIGLGPGKHEIAARAEGFATASKPVEVVSGDKDKVVRIVLVPSHGWVAIKAADAQTAIAIDDKPFAYGSWSGFLLPGVHRVHMYKPNSGSVGEMREIQVLAGKTQEIRPGFGGVFVPTNAAPGTLPPDLPPAPQPSKPEPPKRGFYGLVTGTLLGPLAHPDNFVLPENQTGAAGGFRVGYRVNTPAAFEAMFEYGNVTVDTTRLNLNASYSLSSVRFGLNLRLMSPGTTIRFVGSMGGGLTHDDLEYTIPSADTTCGHCKQVDAFDPYFLGELGLELDFGGVLVGAAFSSYFQATKGLGKDAYGNDPLVWAGGGIRAGYATW